MVAKKGRIPSSDQPDWEKKLEAALEDVKAGRVQRFMSEEEFMAYLKGESKRTRGKAKP